MRWKIKLFSVEVYYLYSVAFLKYWLVVSFDNKYLKATKGIY